MNDRMEDLAAVMGMTTADGTQDVPHLIHHRKLFVLIIYHINKLTLLFRFYFALAFIPPWLLFCLGFYKIPLPEPSGSGSITYKVAYSSEYLNIWCS